MIASRRGFLTGLGAMLAAPAIVHAGNLMPIRGVVMDAKPEAFYGPGFVQMLREQIYYVTEINDCCSYEISGGKIMTFSKPRGFAVGDAIWIRE